MAVINMMIPLLLQGMKITFGVFFITLIFSVPLGVLVAALRLSKNPIISNLMAVYIYLMRGTPLLLQMMFIYFGLPMLPVFKIALGRHAAIYVSFILNYTAYFAEIFRGGIISVDSGQWESGKVLGLSRGFTFKNIILPQVIRPIMPSLSNEVITLVKDTSLVYILGVMDILKAAQSVSNSMSTITPYMYVGVVYLVIVGVFSRILKYVEQKFSYET